MSFIKYLITFLFFATLRGEDAKNIFDRLDPGSLQQALAFYELHEGTPESKKAWGRVEKLLKLDEKIPPEKVVTIINRFQPSRPFTEDELYLIEKLGESLPTRRLKGAQAKSESEVLLLADNEIELGRALLLSQFDGEPEVLRQVMNYTAMLDVMALQILTHLPSHATPEEKIRALNHFIFDENRFRYPPQSIYVKDIDLYTFLPSVMDNHLGVCLGVTTLYLALADRVGLPLEIITPPGHIFLRYRDEKKKINIETTARGINLPDEKYLGLHLKTLPVRTRREVIGMTHINKASTYLYRSEFAKAVTSYKKALPYMPDDIITKELLGFSLVLSGEKEEGRHFLKEVQETPHDTFISHENMIEDYFEGKVDEEGMATIFNEVDEKRETILEKQKKLLAVLKKWPLFRSGIEQLAITYLQLNRYKEGAYWLKKYHSIDDQNPTVEYYLAVLHGERKDYASCWKYLNRAVELTEAKGYVPKTLSDLKKEILLLCPE